MAAPDSLSSTFTTRVVLFACTAAAVTIHAFETLYYRARTYVRDVIKDVVGLELPQPPTVAAVFGARIVEAPKAPLAFAEPAFVGGGAMFRRWR